MFSIFLIFSCDAEPVAFAKYVLALLKKDSSEEKLRDICEEQLNVFLGSSKSLKNNSHYKICFRYQGVCGQLV